MLFYTQDICLYSVPQIRKTRQKSTRCLLLLFSDLTTPNEDVVIFPLVEHIVNHSLT